MWCRRYKRRKTAVSPPTEVRETQETLKAKPVRPYVLEEVPRSPIPAYQNSPTPAQEYAALATRQQERQPTRPARSGTPPISVADSSALASDGTGRRERPPTYIMTRYGDDERPRQPEDMAVYLESSSRSLRADLEKKQDV